MVGDYAQRGYAQIAPNAALLDWVGHAHRAGLASLSDPALAHWHDCEGTWFVGVDALPNDGAGRVGDSAPLAPEMFGALAPLITPLPELHKGQVSVVQPGYPRPRTGESEAGFRYRLKWDGAHVDGLQPIGPERRRMVTEPHQFILGITLNDADPGAAPLSVWEGSHRIMGRAFAQAVAGHAPQDWGQVDVTETYQQARREVFETCPKHSLHVPKGGAVLLHRHLLHGIGCWQDGASAAPEGRMVAYFRPEYASVAPWVNDD